MNCRAIGIEVVSAGEDFSATEVEKLGWLVRELMAKYGIGASGVIRHYDVTGKPCPAPYVAASKWAALKAAITGGAASGGTTPAAHGGTVAELARRVIAGEFGNGGARRAAQAPAADDVDDLARRVIAGEFGNGAARKAVLGDRYAEVQARVNEMLDAGGSGGSAGGADVGALARAVIRGDYGNGADSSSPRG